MNDAPPRSPAESRPYRVLARKYRPVTFASLIGQEAMVRTLTNAFQSGRLAHAFVLTGVRGVGKTTTARIIARALNCIGAEGKGGPTIEPCGVCEHCRAIAEDRHVDVLEMDAASRTGVDEIRELIDGVRYRPTSARYKVYIVDEVHMLSRNAFNALLKTLEEPPEHVKFIFATTEVRKIPVTVLSRCQRFDLRRIDAERLAAHFAAIAKAEGAAASDGALRLIARAADGSVRDGLSLLDQAIALAAEGTIGEDDVRRMLGLADRTQTIRLLEFALRGDAPPALALFAEQYTAGADPAFVLEDMLELVHWLTRIKTTPAAAAAPEVPEAEREAGRTMAGALAVPALARAWQMLLKGLDEVRRAPSPAQAAEMVLVRLAYAADLPSPADLIASLGGGAAVPAAPSAPSRSAAPSSGPSSAATSAPAARSRPASADPREAGDAPQARRAEPPNALRGGGGAAALAANVAPAEVSAPAEAPLAAPRSFAEAIELAHARREAVLAAMLERNVHLVHFEPGRIDFRPTPNAPADLAHQLGRFLTEATGRRWVVAISSAAGEPTLQERRESREAADRARAAEHPLVKAALAAFPGAQISVRRLTEDAPPAAPLAEAPDMPDDAAEDGPPGEPE